MSCLSLTPGHRARPQQESGRQLAHRKDRRALRTCSSHTARDLRSHHEASWSCSVLLRTEWIRALVRSRTLVSPCPASLEIWLESRRCRQCVSRVSLLPWVCCNWWPAQRLAAGVEECAPARPRLARLWVLRFAVLGRPYQDFLSSEAGVLRVFASARDLRCWRGETTSCCAGCKIVVVGCVVLLAPWMCSRSGKC
jgi:hypothetical protein